MSSFGAISPDDAPLGLSVWWPASKRPSPSGAVPRRTECLYRPRAEVDGTFVLGLALLGFPFPEAIRPHIVETDTQ